MSDAIQRAVISSLNVPEVKREVDSASSLTISSMATIPTVPVINANTSAQVKQESRINGYDQDQDQGQQSGGPWGPHDQQCCLVESGRRCQRAAGNASYSKRIQKTVAQKKLKLHLDNSVRINTCETIFCNAISRVFSSYSRPAIFIFATSTSQLYRA